MNQATCVEQQEPEAVIRLHDHIGVPDMEASAWESARTFIKHVHCHGDALINVMSQSDDGRMRQRGGFLVSELDEKLQPIWRRDRKDLYIGINPTYDPRLSKKGRSWYPGHHETKNLRYITTCWVDIDWHEGQNDACSVRSFLWEQYRSGRLPRASVEIESGRGLWLLWILRDPTDPNLSHRGAWNDGPGSPLRRFGEIQKALCSRLAIIGADRNATDAARHIRVPFSLNTSAETFVEWSIHGSGPDCQPYTYTLEGLAALLGIEKPKAKKPIGERRVVRKGNQKRGLEQANRHRLATFTRLEEIRGGFRSGLRNVAVNIYAEILHANGISRGDAARMVGDVGRRCHPVLSQSECAGVVRGAYGASSAGRRACSYATIADKLSVTPDEAQDLSKLTVAPFPAAVKFNDPAAGLVRERVPSRREEQSRLRRSYIRDLLEQPGGIPSLRETVRLLACRGLTASHVTVQSDLAAVRAAVQSPHDQTIKRAGNVAV